MTTGTTTKPAYRLLGVNGDEHTCTLCGRIDLVRVAWLAPLDDDGNEIAAPSPYGTDCAGRLLLGAKTRGNTDTVKRYGEAIARAARWLAAGHSADRVANDCRVRGCICETTETGVRFLLAGDWVEVTK